MSFYDQEGDAHPHLGRALRDLPVPDHGPRFWEHLNERLTALTERPTVAVGRPTEDDPRVASQPAEVLSRRARRADRRGRGHWLRSDPAPPTRTSRRWTTAALVVTLLAVVAGAAAWRLRSDDEPATTAATTVAPQDQTPPPSAPAAVVSQRWSGVVVVDDLDDDGNTRTRQAQVVAGRSGGVRLTDAGDDGAAPTDAGFDPTVGTYREVVADAEPVVRTGLAPAPSGLPTDVTLWRGLVAYVAARAQEGDPAVSAVEEAGRPGWHLTTPIDPAEPGARGADTVDVVVDQELVVPLHLVARAGDEVRLELRLTLDAPTPAGGAGDVFLPELPADPEPQSTDAGWRPAAGPDAAGAPAPLVPAVVPAGFALDAEAVADETEGGAAGSTNPRALHARQQVYRSGWRRLVVTTWDTGGDAAAWGDPFARPGAPTRPTTITLGAGALAGTEAQVVVQPDYEPHLWAVGADRVVTVSGDVSAAQLQAVAESLA